jgi:hypothetical protein
MKIEDYLILHVQRFSWIIGPINGGVVRTALIFFFSQKFRDGLGFGRWGMALDREAV